MNKWVKKSLELAQSTGYLDKLMQIYPPDEIAREKNVEDETTNLKKFFENKNCHELIKELIHLKKKGFKFPIENPYISFLSYSEEAIEKNPKTIRKICEKLFEMDYKMLKEELEAPKKPSRRMGSMFKDWLKKQYTFLNNEEFNKLKNENVFLKGGDNFLKEYAEE
jgi:hypothetical protein